MSEVLVQFDEPQQGSDGRDYVAQVWGQRGHEGLWEAWIEFAPCDGGDSVRTACKTEQLTRGDLRYWAAGLTLGYLTQTLSEALISPLPQHARPFVVAPEFQENRDIEYLVLQTNVVPHGKPVIDPFLVYRQSGEYVLRQELRALHAQQLRDIISAFDVPDMETADLARTFEDALAERIVATVQQSVGNTRNVLVTNQPSPNA